MSTPPTTGRIVHYLSRGSADGKFPATCRAAIVTEDSAETSDRVYASLAVLNPTGLFFDDSIAQDETRTEPGTWHWPCVRT